MSKSWVPPKKRKKGSWVKWFYLVHWTSGAVSLMSILFFAITGVTLNHSDEWGLKPEVRQEEKVLPEALLADLQRQASKPERAKVPGKVRSFLSAMGFPSRGTEWEWSEFEVYGEHQAPGENAWVAMDLETGEVSLEETKRGKVAYFNDLHRGLYTGRVWAGYLDVCAVAIAVFSLTGLGLLFVHAKRRGSTWLLVGLGVLVPVLLALFLIHV